MKAGTEVAATQRFHLNSAGLSNHRGGGREELLCICHVPEERRAARLQRPGSVRGLRAGPGEDEEGGDRWQETRRNQHQPWCYQQETLSYSQLVNQDQTVRQASGF